MKRIIGYARVSSEEQANDGVSLEMQEKRIKAYCKFHDLRLVGFYSEVLSAKTIKKRKVFQQALDHIYSENVNGFICLKLDRLFRNLIEAVSTVRELKEIGCSVISVTENLDTSTAIGEFFFSVLASFAEMERKLIGERTQDALNLKKEKGERCGEIPYGKKLAADGKILINNKQEQDIIATIKDLDVLGYSHSGIARHLNGVGYKTKKKKKWTHVQVARILKGEKQNV
jgi:site-specific DNA recombinase